nr:MAG: replication associated protein [Cressdnaviricota sp.]
MATTGAKRSTCWSITINNPTNVDFEAIKNPTGVHWFLKFIGQEEVGAEGTKHIQGMLRTKSVKFSAVKKLFPRAHIEVAQKPAALEKYVQKEDTRVAKLGDTQYATISDINKTITEIWPTYRHWVDWTNNLPCEEQDKMNLKTLDTITKYLIKKCLYGVEFVASTPTIRSAWNKFGGDIVAREFKEQARRIEEENARKEREENDSQETDSQDSQEESYCESATSECTESDDY